MFIVIIIAIATAEMVPKERIFSEIYIRETYQRKNPKRKTYLLKPPSSQK